MSRIINGTLTVPSFSSTGNVGEYVIEGAIYNNQADTLGNGTADIKIGFLLYVPASDPNTFTMIPGIAHRYKLTNVVIIDQYVINGVCVWDEAGPEQDAPTNGVDCLITQPSDNKSYGFIVDSSIYTALPSYVISAALNDDIKNITDVDVGTTITVLPTDTTPISGHRVIMANDNGYASYASSNVISTASRVIGISTGAAGINSTVNIQTAGPLTEPTWNWIIGPVYVGINGNLTQVVPTTGYILPIGIATNSNTINIGKQIPLVLT